MRQMKIIQLFISLILILSIPQSMAHLIVRADRLPESFKRSTDHAFILERHEIEQRAETTLSGLLSTVPGLQVIQQGPHGGQASLFIRGHDPRHLLVLLDGVIVNDPSNPSSQFDFGHLNTALIERIELLKGPQALLYGSGSLAGVLSITTRKKQDTQLVGLGFGSFDQTLATAQIKSGNIDLGLHHHRQKGFSAAKPQGANKVTDDGRELLEAQLGMQLELGWMGQGRISAGLIQDHFDIDGFDDQGRFVDKPADSIRSLEYRFNFAQENSFFADQLQQRMRLSRFAIKRETFTDGNKQVFQATSYQLQNENQWYWNDVMISLFGLDARFEKAQFPKEYSQKSFAPFFMQRYEGEKLFAMTGLRLNIEDYESSFLSGQMSVGHRSSLLTTTLTLGSGHQAPSLFQRFDPLYGNDKLKREQSYALDLNLKSAPLFENRLTLEMTLFQSNLKDRFDFDPASFRTINNARARIQGAEATLSFNVHHRMSIAFDYTNQLPRDLQNKKILARRAREMFSIRTELKPTTKTSITLSQNYVGPRREFNDERLSSYLLQAMNIRYNLKEKISINLKVENILDKDYEQIKNYQTPKRNALLEGQWIF
jgi:vitamin B12 transporter